MTYDVAIIGGGLGGLSAAVELALRGAHTILLERSPRLGGRCTSFRDRVTGDIVDNGQHVLVGAYHQTLRYLERIGSKEFLLELPGMRLQLHHPEKGKVTFALPDIVAPFDLVAGAGRFSALRIRDRVSLMRSGAKLMKRQRVLGTGIEMLTVQEWLLKEGQSAEALRSFWHPLTLAIMNEHPDRASAQLFAHSLSLVLSGSRKDRSILIPRVGQSELYTENALRLLREQKSEVRCLANVISIETIGGRVGSIRLKNGELIAARQYIVAIPHTELLGLLTDRQVEELGLGVARLWPSTPIVSLHLWFDRPFMESPMEGLIGRTIQWIFDRRLIGGVGAAGKNGYISAVISGAHHEVEYPRQHLVSRAVDELAAVYPSVRMMRLRHSMVIKERRATVSPDAGIQKDRPGAKTPMTNLFLAGDWTNTELPATIEGAVRSGLSAAAAI